MKVEVHGGGVGNLHMLGAMVSPGLYYERGLLHPFIDYDATPSWLNTPPRSDGRGGVRPHLAGARPGPRHHLGLHQQESGVAAGLPALTTAPRSDDRGAPCTNPATALGLSITFDTGGEVNQGLRES